MKNKGFTLIELLAVVSVLGLIMLIAVPSTVNVLEKNKKESFINDAKEIMRKVEVEDQKRGYTDQGFIINKKHPSSYYYSESEYKYMTIENIDFSPYNRQYQIVMVYGCNTPASYGSIRYYVIYMNDGKYQLRAVKGLSSQFFNPDILSYNKDTTPYDLSDATVTRYQMIKKQASNIVSFYNCYTFK